MLCCAYTTQGPWGKGSFVLQTLEVFFAAEGENKKKFLNNPFIEDVKSSLLQSFMFLFVP